MSAKEIFISTVGETPQIITEAIYHFYSSDKPRVFDEIHAITTLLGEKKINEFLFEKNILENLKKDIGFNGEINFVSEFSVTKLVFASSPLLLTPTTH